MAFIALKVPQEASLLLEDVGVPINGERESASDMHVTILYLGKGLVIGDIARAMCSAFTVASVTSPLLCSINTITSFPSNDEGLTPVICPVICPALIQLNKDLKLALDLGAVGYDNKYPEYKPHVTLAYQTGEFKDMSLPGPLSWTAHEMLMWGDDNGFGKVMVHLPFVLNPLEKIAMRLSK